MQTFELDGETIFIDPEDGRPLTVLNPDATIETRWSLPETAYELTTRTTVIDEVLEALESLKLSKQARSAVEQMLEALPR